MGRFIPEILLEWREPEPVRRGRDASELKALRGLFRPVLILVFVGLSLPVWFIQQELPGGAPLPFWAQAFIGVGLGILVCYGCPWLSARLPSRIWISEAALSRSTGGRIVHVRHADLLGCALETRAFEGSACRVLVLRH